MGKKTTPKDVYGVLTNNEEMDSNVNEDPNREELLDESLVHYLDVYKVNTNKK